MCACDSVSVCSLVCVSVCLCCVCVCVNALLKDSDCNCDSSTQVKVRKDCVRMHTCTHTHVGFLWFTGTFHRRNGFYTVQTVSAIALHLPYT